METKILLEIFKTCSGVSIDTRTINKGDLFVALKGPNFDGNAYVQKAIDLGAKHCLSSDEGYANHEQVTFVKDGLTALQHLATAYRDTWDFPVLALTGSNGKTTTKELLAQMLGTSYKVSSTVGNLNNHIGVPLTLLRCPDDVEIIVVEMGANHVGEIAQLAKIAKPTHGFITNIGKAHLEGFGGIDGIRQGKGELFDYLKLNGLCFINASDPEIIDLSPRAGKRIIFGREGQIIPTAEQAIFFGKMNKAFPTVKGEFIVDGLRSSFGSHLPGAYNFSNILVAAAVSSYFKVPTENIVSAVSNYIPDNQRSETRKLNQATILLDAYNANPDSMSSAISWLINRSESNKYVILGEMAELGDQTNEEHKVLLERVISLGADNCAFFGSTWQGIAPEERVYTEIKKLKSWVQMIATKKESVLLMKGSRVNKLERLLD